MLDMTVDVLNAYVNGQLVVDDSSLDKMLISTAVIDSRVVQKDSLFIAFKGDSVDGHAYINAAAENGACIALVEDVIENAAIAQIKVSSCKKAMADLAIACRDKYQGKVIGITGSCGKTSTKEMLACILKLSASVSVTSGNQNNELGVPLTLFNIDKDSDYAVIEMGAAEKGDISYLMAMVKPDVVVVTNIRPAHIGRFGSEETIAETKSEIYRDLQLHTTAVINLDEKYSRQWIAEIEVLNKSQVLSFSMDHLQAELTITDLILSLGQSEFTLHYQLNDQSLNQKIRLNVAGEHNVANALAAASCALAVGISLADIAEGLANYHGVKSRMQLQNAVWGGLIIDDSYNANPASVAAAIDVLKH
ncbi:MAG: UDP-N-acetylmuramoyl-tripeptide--D-alanyl-D-alanine ligase, partial [Pseudomonadales bacterium]|nr:UDP-N-acetylmuramoyl-tripeptide--D-alanyl-D-alanine ligase [Pseudomonadales bacterium]